MMIDMNKLKGLYYDSYVEDILVCTNNIEHATIVIEDACMYGEDIRLLDDNGFKIVEIIGTDHHLEIEVEEKK